MSFYINPGSGPIADAGLEYAQANMEQLIQDANVPDAEVRYAEAEYGGRYAFEVTFNGRTATVDMPGIPLESMRYLGKPQNIWDYPRMYVDGSSWVWKFGMSILEHALTGDLEDE